MIIAKNHRWYPILLLLCVVLVPAGAGGQRSAGKAAGQRLVIYTYDAFPGALEESIRNHFEGAEVEVQRFQDTGGLYTQLLLEKDAPKADVAIGLDSTYLPAAFRERLFQRYEPKELNLARDDLLVDPQYRVVPFDYGAIALNYDSEVLKDPPRSWNELLDPKYRNQIILMNPATSSPGKNFLLFTVLKFGEDGFLDYWRNLKPNILTVTSGWSEGYGLYTQGEAPMVLSYDTSPAYHKQYEETDRYRNLIFDGEAYAQIEVAGILAGARNLALAQQCMDHILSSEFQTLIPLNQFMYPVQRGVELPDAFVWAGPAPYVVQLDDDTVAENYDRWLELWESVMR